MAERDLLKFRNIDELRNYVKTHHGVTESDIIDFLKEQPITLLIQNLEDESGIICTYSAMVIGDLGDISVVPILIKYLNPGFDQQLQCEILKALGKLGDLRAFEPILKVLQGEGMFDSYTRGVAAYALGLLRNERAVPFLIESLCHGDSEIRYWTGLGLALLGNAAVPALIKCLGDAVPIVRGKTLAILYKIWIESNFPDKEALDLVISCWNDPKYWIRWVAAEVLRLWSKRHPLEIFQKMKPLILMNIRLGAIDEPATGNGIGEYAVRLLSSIYEKSSKEMKPLNEEFADLMNLLRDLYEKCKGDADPKAIQCKANVLSIMMYITSFREVDSWPWDEETAQLVTYPDRPQICWMCESWRHGRVPLEELQEWLKSENYKYLKNRINEEVEVETIIDSSTGAPPSELEEEFSKCFTIFGYCMKHHKATDADDRCDFYLPRQLKFPVNYILVELDTKDFGAFLIWVKVDAIMRDHLKHWLMYPNYGWGVVSFLKEAALKCEVVHTTDHSKRGSAIFYVQLYHQEGKEREERIFLENMEKDSEKFFLTEYEAEDVNALGTDGLEKILRGKIYSRRYTVLIHSSADID